MSVAHGEYSHVRRRKESRCMDKTLFNSNTGSVRGCSTSRLGTCYLWRRVKVSKLITCTMENRDVWANCAVKLHGGGNPFLTHILANRSPDYSVHVFKSAVRRSARHLDNASELISSEPSPSLPFFSGSAKLLRIVGTFTFSDGDGVFASRAHAIVHPIGRLFCSVSNACCLIRGSDLLLKIPADQTHKSIFRNARPSFHRPCLVDVRI